ncbi:ThiF family adenylyltransferase [Kangiella koreensis]|uniref:UBA/THIF-type NAD/FAD binding protein n=1 Tax=Kangiella koreensis (strain DSM 16069 / JCM 12317 / KCTC 12182 / SW-125) TaxID=523791 RepID=C7R646_KANKD|nr:ThiF family adenylyltransferase [Kangiella koreensis]ACV25477.1 UBA/THIF-type NAD/FAD binding protein [Kangiella koreensis DSM 16069]
MDREYTITFRYEEFNQLKQHLFPGDKKEAVAFALCSIAQGVDKTRLLVREIISLPKSAYIKRTPQEVLWETSTLIPVLGRLEKENICLIKCHSHPDGIAEFSAVDDKSDKSLLPSFYEWNPVGPHASLVMCEDNVSARIVLDDGSFKPVNCIQIIGERLSWYRNGVTKKVEPEQQRLVQAFGEGTYSALSNLRVAVIGASGIGSLVNESLMRTGVGEIVTVDPDHVDFVNLNRILYSTKKDAQNKVNKTSLLRMSVATTGLDTKITELPYDLKTPDVIKHIAGCDLIMGCVDNREARQILCRIAAFYLLPYIDAGVAIRAESKGEIESISAAIHYIQPGQSFLSRRIFDIEALRSDAMQRANPDHFKEQLNLGYVSGVDVERPAVMPLNMIAAGYSVMELLARIHGYRGDIEDEKCAAETLISVDIGYIKQRPDTALCTSLARYIGLGDVVPLLGMPVLSMQEEDAA